MNWKVISQRLPKPGQQLQARHNVQHQVACVSRKGTIIPAGIAMDSTHELVVPGWMLLDHMLPGFQRWHSRYAASRTQLCSEVFIENFILSTNLFPVPQIRSAPSSACGIQILHILRHGAILISGIQLLHLQPVPWTKNPKNGSSVRSESPTVISWYPPWYIMIYLSNQNPRSQFILIINRLRKLWGTTQ